MSNITQQKGKVQKQFSVYLASQSPRRKELLRQVGLDYMVVSSSYEEQNDFTITPRELVKKQALGKARGVILESEMPVKPIIGADTVVVYENKILGKPKDCQEAKKMLQLLSGQKHQVMTGVAIVNGYDVEVFVVVTEVTFRTITNEEIDWYVQSGEPLDKAGAYGIQGMGALWIEEIKGSYTNVVGLPVEKVFQVLKRM